jgi:hypothetical protein
LLTCKGKPVPLGIHVLVSLFHKDRNPLCMRLLFSIRHKQHHLLDKLLVLVAMARLKAG